MQTRMTGYKYIIFAALMVVGVSIAGWAFAFYYDNSSMGAMPQKEAQNAIQAVSEMPLQIDNIKLTLLLVCTGLIGFLSVRRQSNSLKRFAGVDAR